MGLPASRMCNKRSTFVANAASILLVLAAAPAAERQTPRRDRTLLSNSFRSRQSADHELPALSASFLFCLDGPARYLPGSGDAGIDGAFRASGQSLAVSQRGGGDGGVPADQTNRSFMTLRHRTLKLGERLDERVRERAWFEPPSTTERRQMELNLSNDSQCEFVVSIDTAHLRANRAEAGRNFEIVVARCAAAGAVRAQAAISRRPTLRSATFNLGRCRPCRARAMRTAAR